MALILGIDPGSRITGYGLVQNLGQSVEYVDSGCIRLPSANSLADRLLEIFQSISEIIKLSHPDEVAIEEVFMSRNADSALKLGQARGVAIVAARVQGIPVYEYAARQVKQAVVGMGAARKDQVNHMVRVLLNLPGEPQQDAADALAIAICHVNTSKGISQIVGALNQSSGSGQKQTYSRGRYTLGDG